MKTHIVIFFSVFALLISLGLTGCPGGNGADRPPLLEGVPDGTGTGIGQGYASSDPNFLEYNPDFGAPITVTVTVQDGLISAVAIYGPDETPGWGSLIIDQAPSIITRTNRFELRQEDFDVIASSTRTIDGINEAGINALENIMQRYGAP